MNPATPPAIQNPLAQLRDIHLPEPIGWWPLAPSLWIAIILVTASVLAVGWVLYKRRCKNRYRREAVALLNQQISEYQCHKQQQKLCQQLLTTLRRCLLSANQGNKTVAVNLSAAELLQQLNLSVNKPLFSKTICEQVQILIYADQPTPIDDQQLDQLLHSARTCIKVMP